MTVTALAIRAATPADLETLHPVIERAYRGSGERPGWTHEADLLDGQRTDMATLRAILETSGTQLLVAEGNAGIAGCVSERAAHTALPLASAAIAANGLQGTYLHVRGIAQKPGGWRMARYNIELGPPLFAPLLMSMVGGMGLLASVLRRER